MKFKNILTSFALALAIAVPSVSSAMTSDQVKNSLGSITILLDMALSVLDNNLATVPSQEALTSLTDVSDDAKDANEDGEIDREDLVYIQEAILASETPSSSNADINGDGVIDNDDFILLRNHFVSSGDYVSAYDMDTIGSGWTIVPADGVIDQKDVNTIIFAKAVEEKDEANYSIFFDLNYDGTVNQRDVTFLEDYIEGSEEPSESPSEAPVITDSHPQGELSAGLFQTYISVSTDSPAYCSYSSNESDSYENMTPMEHTALGPNNDYHAQLITDAERNVDIIFYIKCKSFDGVVMEDPEEIKFSFGPTVVSNVAPSIVASFPNKTLVSTTKEYYFKVSTNMPAKCSYSQDEDDSYEEMTQMALTSLGENKNFHFQLITGLEPGYEDSVYVRCESFQNKAMEESHLIEISVEGNKNPTIEDLQQMIDDLLEQVEDLNS